MLQSWLPYSLKQFVRDDSATTSIEYALIASVVSIAIIGSASTVGDTLIDNFYNKIVGGMEGAGMSDGANEGQQPQQQ